MRYVVRLLAVIGVLFILLFAGIIYGLTRINIAANPPPQLSRDTVLTVTVDGPFIEEAPLGVGLPGPFASRGRKLRDTIDGIDLAARDSRIKGLIVKLDDSAGLAQTQELRAALARFRAAGKFAYAFADSYGQSSPGNGEYYLASACDQVWMQPMGEVMVAGVVFEAPFAKEALAKLKIEPQFSKRAEYKTAPEVFTESGFTPAAREMMEGLANDITLQLVTDIAASRKLEAAQIRAAFDRGPMTAREAIDAHLIDRVGYADEVVKAAKESAGPRGHVVALDDFYRAARPRDGVANVALVYAVGEIGRVEGPIDPAEGERRFGREAGIVRGFAKAMENDAIKSIVLRVDSPGGSVTGSESIRRAVLRAKEAGKKIVVSMGTTAASGGYWISVDADKIVANPGTLTGSIGVFTGKFAINKGLADIGITTDRTSAGPFAAMDSPFAPYTPEQNQRINATLDNVYGAFIARVAEGRKLPPGVVEQSAKGRVWSGQQAKQIGLVDELGGLHEAIEIAGRLAGLPEGERPKIRIYPQPLTPLEMLRGVLHGDADVEEAASDAISALDGPGGLAIQALTSLFRNPAEQMVRMPIFSLPR